MDTHESVSVTNSFKSVYLTPRQRQVLALVALEYTTEEIARLIDREPKTVEGHLACIYQRLRGEHYAFLTMGATLAPS